MRDLGVGPELLFVPESPWAFGQHLNPFDLEWLKYTGEGCDIIRTPDDRWGVGWWNDPLQTYWPVGWTNETYQEYVAPDWAWALDEISRLDVAMWCIQRGFAFPPGLLREGADQDSPIFDYVAKFMESHRLLRSYPEAAG